MLFTILAAVGGCIFGATIGYAWVHKQLASAKADLAAVVAKFAPQFVSTPTPAVTAASVAAAVASAKK